MKGWHRTARPGSEASPRFDLEKEADRIVWERYAHAGNRGEQRPSDPALPRRYQPIPTPAPGQATFNLSKMLREELQLELRAAIREARKSGRSVRREAISGQTR